MNLIASASTLNSTLETWFIQHQLFNGDPYRIKENLQFPFNHEVYAYLELFEIDVNFIQQLVNKNHPVVLIHLGDEFGKKNKSAYPLCNLILRSYFFSDLFSQPDLKDQLLWIPNGFRTGVGPRLAGHLLPAPQRTHLASFMGWIHNPDSFQGERDSFLRMLKTIRKSKNQRFWIFEQWLNKRRHPSRERHVFSQMALDSKDLYLLSTSGFGDGNQVGLYSAILENSIFAPCPAGNSPETIRLYDALECGCIPISLSHEFIHSPLALGRFGTPPFPLLASWDELPSFLMTQKQRFREDPDAVKALQAKCIAWWSHYKREMAALIHAKFSTLMPKQN